MKPFFALVAKQLHESRWNLIFSVLALFALGWLYVFFVSVNEGRILKALSSTEEGQGFGWMRNMGMSEQPPTIVIMMAFWNNPFVQLTMAIWAIGRGSVAVGAEVERGTLDMILSRPVSRSSYLSSQVLVAVGGLLLLALALAAGASVGARYNTLRQPPLPDQLFRPAINLAALGLAVYSYTLLISAMDHVRWRATTFGSVLTMAGFISNAIALAPAMQKYEWRVWLQRLSIFRLFNPVDAVSEREFFLQNLQILGGIGMVCILLAYIVFSVRDLPANG